LNTTEVLKKGLKNGGRNDGVGKNGGEGRREE
jgi:hypothetical protein